MAKNLPCRILVTQGEFDRLQKEREKIDVELRDLEEAQAHILLKMVTRKKLLASLDARRKKLFDQGMEVAEALDERAKKRKETNDAAETFDSPFNVDWSAIEIPADFAFLSGDTPAIPVDSPGNST